MKTVKMIQCEGCGRIIMGTHGQIVSGRMTITPIASSVTEGLLIYPTERWTIEPVNGSEVEYCQRCRP